MSLNESIIEDAALEWFGEQCRWAPSLIPALSRGEKERRKAIRRPAGAGSAIPDEARRDGILRFQPDILN